MVWTAFTEAGKLEISFVRTDMNSEAYQQLLNDELLPFIRKNKNRKFIFQQDNARIHVSRSTKCWFQDNGIDTLEWPPHSSDLNPIHDLWGIIARDLYSEGKKYKNIDELKQAILKSWDAIPNETLKSLSKSMYHKIFMVGFKKGHKVVH